MAARVRTRSEESIVVFVERMEREKESGCAEKRRLQWMMQEMRERKKNDKVKFYTSTSAGLPGRALGCTQGNPPRMRMV